MPRRARWACWWARARHRVRGHHVPVLHSELAVAWWCPVCDQGEVYRWGQQ